MKNLFTFVSQFFSSGSKPLNLSGLFFGYSVITILIKRCRNYRDCLNTIPLLEVWDGKYDTVFCCAPNNQKQ